MDITLDNILEWLKSAWSAELFMLGDNPFRLKTMTVLIVSLFLLFFLTGWLKRFMVKRVFPR
jgi:hypothetical protein